MKISDLPEGTKFRLGNKILVKTNNYKVETNICLESLEDHSIITVSKGNLVSLFPGSYVAVKDMSPKLVYMWYGIRVCITPALSVGCTNYLCIANKKEKPGFLEVYLEGHTEVELVTPTPLRSTKPRRLSELGNGEIFETNDGIIATKVASLKFGTRILCKKEDGSTINLPSYTFTHEPREEVIDMIKGYALDPEGHKHRIPVTLSAVTTNQEVYKALKKLFKYMKLNPSWTYVIEDIEGPFKEYDLAAMFIGCPENCKIPEKWRHRD